MVPSRALLPLKSLKRKCKAHFLDRIKFEFGIQDCRVELTRIKLQDDVPVEVKSEPIDEYYINIECIKYNFHLHTLMFNNFVLLPFKLLIYLSKKKRELLLNK